MAGVVNRIADASQRQTDDSNRLKLAVGGIDAVTRQNASLVEQVNAAADVLSGQTDALMMAVSVIKPLAAESDARKVLATAQQPGLGCGMGA